MKIALILKCLASANGRILQRCFEKSDISIGGWRSERRRRRKGRREFQRERKDAGGGKKKKYSKFY